MAVAQETDARARVSDDVNGQSRTTILVGSGLFVAIEASDRLSDGESLSARWYGHRAASELKETLHQQMPEIADVVVRTEP